ncbi:MAG TPA: nuclease-related domain-containing protein [Bryobacteraceae bacterium]|nr:nuclease-related domain-containing protein [Bryobacteraceae bacterium]
MSFVTFVVVYLIVVMGALFAAIQWLKGKRRPKLPFKPDRDRLLRGPGESLKRKIEAMDENMIYLLVALMALPILAGLGVLAGLQQSQTGTTGQRLAAGLLVALGTLLAGSWYLAKEAIRRGNHHLGWFGERMTAEELDPLREQGWRVFHDVPAESGKYDFNIDHVLVGPGGVFSIETKMRRMGHARPGRKDHEVRYDGKVLSWPWTEDTYGLKQAADNARWLRDWLSLMTGENVPVTPVLIFPGWYVVPPNAVHPVSVVHPSYLPGFVNLRTGILNSRQIDLLARQLEARCRDVEY